jgi:hypothetical protein
MTRYCTLAQAKAQIKATKTVDDDDVFDFIAVVSQRIDGLLNSGRKRKRPYFAPYVEARPFKARAWNVNSQDQILDLGENLLELTSVVTNGQNVTANIQVYIADFPPFTKLQLSNNNFSWYTLDQSPPEGRRHPEPLIVTGIWGYHDDYDNAWADSADDLAAGADATTTTIKVSNADLFSPGNLILVDDEYMEVTATDTTPTPDELTVVRGVNGSTAATHLINADVFIWQIAEEIAHVTARQAAKIYAKKGAFEVSMITLAGIVQYPRDLTAELLSTLEPYLGNY